MIKQTLKTIATSVLLTATILYGAVQAPQLHEFYLRHYVGSSVVYILNEAGTGGGTGFVIKSHNGKNYTVSNSHVCDGVKQGNTVIAKTEKGKKFKLRILKSDPIKDLCVMTPVPGIAALSLGTNSVGAGTRLWSVGHPMLMPLTISAGYVLSSEEIMIYQGQRLQADCSKPGYIWEPSFLELGDCISIHKSWSTSMVIFGGNSGSPVVDVYGRVVAVVFASNTRSNWGSLVPFEVLDKYLPR